MFWIDNLVSSVLIIFKIANRFTTYLIGFLFSMDVDSNIHNLDFAEKVSDKLPLIEDDLRSEEFQMQSFPMRPIHEEDHQYEVGEIETVIQDYIEQVASSNLRARRSFSRGLSLSSSRDEGTSVDFDVSIPDLEQDDNIADAQQPPVRSRSVRFTPETQTTSTPKISPRPAALKNPSLKIDPIRPTFLGEQSSTKAKEIEVTVAQEMEQVVEENRKSNTLNQKKLQEAEKLLRLAFVEFYRGLSLLKSYRFESRINLYIPFISIPRELFFL